MVESGQLVPGEIVAVMGKTEGNGCVNDLRARVRGDSLVRMARAVAGRHAGAGAYTRGADRGRASDAAVLSDWGLYYLPLVAVAIEIHNLDVHHF